MDNAKQLSDLYPLVMDHLPGIDPYILEQHLQEAVRKFCDESNALREKLAPIDLVAGQCRYTLTPSLDCRIKVVSKLWLRSSADISNGLNGTLYPDGYYDIELPDTLVLAQSIKPREAVTDGLLVEVVLVPDIVQSGTNVMDLNFFNNYANGICARALYTLKMLPKQRWSDPNTALQIHLKDYFEAVTDAKCDIELNGKMQPAGFGG